MSEWVLDADIEQFYDLGGEQDRLSAKAVGRLEFLRVQDLLRRLLPGRRLRVLDVGGGTGVHAAWLAGDGHRVTLVDPVASQVEVADALPGVEAVVADARELPYPDGSFDAVLLLGPLYHLPDRSERLLALREARRVAAPGALVVAATINRLAALTNRLGLRVDPSGYYRRSHEEEWTMLRTGFSRGHREGTFPTAHLHNPAEIAGEFDEAGLAVAGQYSVQGLACFAPGLAVLLDDETERAFLLEVLREFESAPDALQAGFHLLTAAVVR
jgi:SAM-dependent methyltransferase